MGDEPIPLASDVFFCPACGQKHRGDLSAPRSGAELLVRCAGCATKLRVRWKGDRASVKYAERRGAPVREEDTLHLRIPVNLTRTAAMVGATVLPTAGATATLDDDGAAPGGDGGRRGTRARDKVRPDGPGRSGAVAPPEPDEFPAGTMIGRYRVESATGRGGTRRVYRAFDATTHRYVALKILGPDQPEVMRQRFLREIEVQANLRHPNLMPVFDRGEHEGRPFFAMEMLYRPFTLTEIVRMARDGSLSRYVTLKPLETVEGILRGVFLPVCAAMQVANVENGVLHRDLKPDNVLVDSRTLRAYVIDFGICELLERHTRIGGVTLAPTADDAGIVGTPRYLAPEQARGTVHERTDVWGLGAILRFCLTGEPPIAAANPITRAELKRRIQALTVAQAIAQETGDDAKSALCAEKLARLEDTGLRTYDDLFEDARDGVYTPLPPEIPPVVSAILHKAMAPRPGDRYESPRALAEDVEAWIAGSPTRARLAEPGGAPGLLDRLSAALRDHALAAVAATAVLTASAFTLPGLLASRSRAEVTLPPALRDLFAAADAELDAAARLATAPLAAADAARVHDGLERALVAHRAAAAGLPAGAERAEAQTQLDAVARRIAPQQVRVVGTGGAPAPADVLDVSRPGPVLHAAAGDLRLAPGEYRVTVGGVEVPLVVPLLVRERGAPSREDARFVLRVPSVAGGVPKGMVLVVPPTETVVCRRPPWTATAEPPVRVGPFLLDRHEVTVGRWAAFLDAIDDDHERERRVPNLDFVEDPARPRRYVVAAPPAEAERARERPVRGISPADALAFCAWRSKVEGRAYRLPTEAEWAVAAGLALGHTRPGEGADLADDGIPPSIVRVTEVRDVTPYGVAGLRANVREIVRAVVGDGAGPAAFLAKGAGAGDGAGDAVILRVRRLAEDARDERTGLRCAADAD